MAVNNPYPPQTQFAVVIEHSFAEGGFLNYINLKISQEKTPASLSRFVILLDETVAQEHSRMSHPGPFEISHYNVLDLKDNQNLSKKFYCAFSNSK